LLQKQGENIALNDLQKLLLSIDTDRNGKINYNEFIAMCIDEAIMSNDDYMKFAFNSFDLNRDGKIQREEFQLILKAYSKDFGCNEELVDALMKENDKNNDGVIDFSEFKSAMISVRSQSIERASRNNVVTEPF
jgi:calcium-dependent protein kinase